MSLSSISRLALACPALLIGSACMWDNDEVCITPGVWGIEVHVLDSTTGVAIDSGSFLLVEDGAYRDSVAYFYGEPFGRNWLPLVAADTRLGVYTVTVRHQGYRDWVKPNVRVRRGGPCNQIQTSRLTARLQTLP